MKYAIQDTTVLEARKCYEHFTRDDKLREAYEAHMKYIRDITSMHETGIEEGVEIGLVKGREEGREEGLRSTARNFLAMGMSIEQVAQGTGLSIDEVVRIEKDMH